MSQIHISNCRLLITVCLMLFNPVTYSQELKATELTAKWYSKNLFKLFDVDFFTADNYFIRKTNPSVRNPQFELYRQNVKNAGLLDVIDTIACEIPTDMSDERNTYVLACPFVDHGDAYSFVKTPTRYLVKLNGEPKYTEFGFTDNQTPDLHISNRDQSANNFLLIDLQENKLGNAPAKNSFFIVDKTNLEVEEIKFEGVDVSGIEGIYFRGDNLVIVYQPLKVNRVNLIIHQLKTSSKTHFTIEDIPLDKYGRLNSCQFKESIGSEVLKVFGFAHRSDVKDMILNTAYILDLNLERSSVNKVVTHPLQNFNIGKSKSVISSKELFKMRKTRNLNNRGEYTGIYYLNGKFSLLSSARSSNGKFSGFNHYTFDENTANIEFFPLEENKVGIPPNLYNVETYEMHTLFLENKYHIIYNSGKLGKNKLQWGIKYVSLDESGIIREPKVLQIGKPLLRRPLFPEVDITLPFTVSYGPPTEGYSGGDQIGFYLGSGLSSSEALYELKLP